MLWNNYDCVGSVKLLVCMIWNQIDNFYCLNLSEMKFFGLMSELGF